MINILGFVDHIIFVITIQLCQCTVKAVLCKHKGESVLIKLYIQQAVSLK